jgi:hypothetical protein
VQTHKPHSQTKLLLGGKPNKLGFQSRPAGIYGNAGKEKGIAVGYHRKWHEAVFRQEPGRRINWINIQILRQSRVSNTFD